MTSFVVFLSAAAAYLLGSINTAILVGKCMKNIDIRDYGSKNAGTTNALRVLGKKAAAIVALGDAVKGVIAVLVSMLLCKIFNVSSKTALYAAGLFAVLGHNFPLYFKFKGGKGVLTSIVTVIMLDPFVGTITLLFAVLVIALTRYVSLGSCLGAVLLVILSLVFRIHDVYFVVLCFILAVLVLVRHKQNIKRLISGTESKLGAKNKTNQ